ncbi:MAG: PilZ domain-containing protein [Acidiferrobacterales bacterium]
MSTGTNIGDAEKRSEPRHAVTHQFTLIHESLGEITCNTGDLSLNGAFVAGDFSRVSIGSTISVSFILPSKRPGAKSAMRYRFNAIVVRVTVDGAGLSFAGLDADTDAAIYDLMHR